MQIYFHDGIICGVNMMKSLRSVDMNLLVVFDALMSELNVTRAGARLGMSQPAVSNALQRLRHLLGDRLFVRGGDGIKPTSRAVALAEPVREALATIEAVLMPSQFDPGSSQLTFYLALSDHANLCVMPALSERVAEAAPGIRLECLPKTLPTLPNLLEKNQVDIAIGIFGDIPARLQSEVLFKDEYVCLMRTDHPLTAGPMSLERIADYRHVLLRSAMGARALLDQTLADRGLRRDVVMTTIQAGAIPGMVENGGLISCLLKNTLDLESLGRNETLLIRPLEIERAEIKMIWHASTSENPASTWLRDQIREVCEPFRRQHP